MTGSEFDFAYVDNRVSRTLVLLHGTGGGKEDFLFLDQALNRTYNLLSLQGNISENGMARFFKRNTDGSFDQESIRAEVHNLHEFLNRWMQKHPLSSDNSTFLGYSNGANMILALLFSYPTIIKNLIVLHPMLPFPVAEKSFQLDHHRAFVSSGMYDRLIPATEQAKVVHVLRSCSAWVTVKEYPSGHELTSQEILDIISFLT